MSFQREYFRTSEELLAALEDLEKEEAECGVDAVIIPPDVDENTDEEDIDDNQIVINDGGDHIPSDIAGSFEVHHSVSNEIIINRKKPKVKEQKSHPNWENSLPNVSKFPDNSAVNKRVEEIKNQYGDLSILEAFYLIFDDAFLDKIINFSVVC
jgi:hypothetical protein